MSQQYSKRTWADEVPAISPMKYAIVDDTDGDIATSATIVPKSGAITTPGTAVNATNLNQLEDGLDIASKQSTRQIAMAGGTKTISSGAITSTPASGHGRYLVDTESSAAFDDLDTISGGADGDVILLMAANSARVVRIRSGSGNIITANSRNIRLTTESHFAFRYDGTNWRMLDDGRVLGDPLFLNNDGTDHALGTVVIIDTSADYACIKTTRIGDPKVLGIAAELVEAGKTGRYIQSGQATVLVQGNVARGAWLVADSTSGRAKQYGFLKPDTGGVGIAQTAYSGGGAGSVVAVLQLGLSHTVDLQQLATSTNYLGTGTTINASHVCDSGTDLLVVRVAHGSGGTISGMTFNGASLTKLDENSSTYTSAIWYLRNPTNATYNLVITCSASITVDVYITNYSGSQSTPFRTTAKASGPSTSASVSPSCAVGDIVVDTLMCNIGSGYLTGGQTAELVDKSVTGAVHHHCSKKAGVAGSTTMSYAFGSTSYAIIAVAIAGS